MSTRQIQTFINDNCSEAKQSETDRQTDVLFVLPPFFRFLDDSFLAYPSGLGTMVSVLKKEGFKAAIYNADHGGSGGIGKTLAKVIRRIGLRFHRIARQWTRFYLRVHDTNDPIWQETRQALKLTRPRIVGISSSVVTVPCTLELARLVKETCPDATVLVGGPAAATCSDVLLTSVAIDFLVIGEGERTIVELTRHILDKGNNESGASSIDGLMYMSDGKVVTTRPRALIEDLNTIPFPDRKAMFRIDRNGRMSYIEENHDVITSRGCPYLCRFCACHQIWGTRKPRMRSVDNTISELKYLIEEHGEKSFVFWDDLFTVDRSRVVELCNALINAGMDVDWACLVRLNTIDRELLALMKKAGCREVQVGIESGNDRVLKHIKKGLTLKTIRERVPMIEESGIDYGVFLIIGFPTETKEEIEDTLAILGEMNPTWVNISIFSPYPGCDFHDDLRNKGVLGDEYWKADFWYPNNNYTGTMDDAEFKAIAMRVLKSGDFYNLKQWYRRVGKMLFKRLSCGLSRVISRK